MNLQPKAFDKWAQFTKEYDEVPSYEVFWKLQLLPLYKWCDKYDSRNSYKMLNIKRFTYH